MKAKSFLLEILTGALSLFAWLFGFPLLSEVSKAINLVGILFAGGLAFFGCVLLVLIIQSQRQAPYE